jgi:hypothetical protein
MRKNGYLIVLILANLSPPARAQVVGVALDPKAELVDGEVRVLPSPPTDSVVFFEFSGAKAKTLGQVVVPTSFQGPPSAVAISADRTLALVSASTRIDPRDPKAFAPDNRLSVIDISAKPIRVAQTVELGASPSSIAMNRAGTMALALHSSDDSVTVMSIANHRVTIVEKLPMAKGAAPSAAAFNPDGRTVLMSLADRIALFAVEAGRLTTPAIREMSAGVYPTVISYCGSTGLAVVGNYGRVTGDADTISLIDVAGPTARVVDTASVGPAPEGVACSPDGHYAAAAIQNMATVPKSNPFYSPNSMVVLLKIEGKRLHRAGAAPFGAWAQGVGFLDDSRTLFAQSLSNRSLHLFRIDGGTLRVAAPPMVFKDGGPVSSGISGR